jgi:hypothetical protein
MSPDVAGGERIVMRLQVQELLEQLNDVERALEHQALDAALRERVAVRFQRLVAARRAELRTLRDAVDDGAMESADVWVELSDIRSAVRPLAAECLALLEGGLVRATGLDRGLCRIADALLGELARLSECPWDRFTILDDGEYFNSLAEVVRLRFPDLTIWGLPVAAHEFGHFVGHELSGDADTEAMFGGIVAQRVARKHVDEHFADCYATYALGPAFVCVAVLQRFDPRTPALTRPTHPPATDRVSLCLHILRKMDGAGGILSPFHDVVEALERTWNALVYDATGAAPAQDAAEQARLSTVGDILWDVLELKAGGVRYSNRDLMAAKSQAPPLLDAVANGRTPGIAASGLRDILNAAWLARLSGPPEAVMAVADWGLRSCVAQVPNEAAVEEAKE